MSNQWITDRLNSERVAGWPPPQGRGRAGGMPGTTRKTQQTERLLAIRLRYCINTHLDEQGLTAAPDIAQAVGLPQAEAARLLNRRQWRDGDITALQAVADRLGLDVPLDGLGLPPG